MVNPYEPPETEPSRKPEGIEIDFVHFTTIFFVVLIGTPLIYNTALELMGKILNEIF